MLTYGPNGISRGIATIIFSKPGSANDALVQLNGMLVDKRPMKVRPSHEELCDPTGRRDTYVAPGGDRCGCFQGLRWICS